MKIYTAGPITGLSYDKVMDRYEKQVAILKSYGYDVVCPMTGKGYLKYEKALSSTGYKHPTATNHAIKGRDMWMVRYTDIVLVDFTDSEVASIGSCMEMAWASMLGKHIVIVLPDNNIHKHAFILECADVIFNNITDAYEYLESLIKGI